TYLDTTEQIAVDVCEKPFKNYLKSTISLMDSKTQQMKTKLDIESLINMSYKKYDRNNTLIGTPESCQELLYQIEEIGVTEVACFVDFGIEKDKVLSGIKRITEARDLYNLTKM